MVIRQKYDNFAVRTSVKYGWGIGEKSYLRSFDAEKWRPGRLTCGRS